MSSGQHASGHAAKQHASEAQGSGHYRRLLLMIVASFIAMFVLMYAMVDRFENAVPNINQVYMAGLMTAPMLVLELTLMGGMYPNKRLNAALVALGVIAGILCWILIRQQVGVGDRQFLRSMIPHHAGAILMCNQASVQDPDVQGLCKGIIASQSDEIALMKRILEKND